MYILQQVEEFVCWLQISGILQTCHRKTDQQNDSPRTYNQCQVWFTLGWKDEKELRYHDQAEQKEE